MAIRGVRGKVRQAEADPIALIAFNLIPEALSYECPYTDPMMMFLWSERR